MSLKQSWNEKAWPRILLAFAVNLVFLTVMLTAFAPMWETNDDLLMSKFVDGQLSEKTVYVPYIHVFLGALLKGLYTLFGNGFNWYSACQYLALFLGFAAITWSLLRRFRPLPALVMTAVNLGAFGTDCYLSMNFSKAGAVGTVGGMALLLTWMQGREKPKTRLCLCGVLLALCGLLWRWEEFGICALLMAAVCLRDLIGLLRESRGLERRARLGALWAYLKPFTALALLAVALFAAFQAAWNLPGITAYKRFDDTRSVLIDFEIPEYDQIPEVYDELQMDENFVYLMKKWSFYDTERFTQENMERIIAARDQLVRHKTPGECLGVFLKECLRGFTLDRPFAGFGFLLALWLVCGRRRGRDWAALAYMGAVFFGVYMLFIYNERYLANRVDIGLFLSMAVGLSFLLDEERLAGENWTLLAVLVLSLFVTWRANRPYCLLDSHNTVEDKSFDKAAVETLLRDTEHRYFVKVWALDHNLYSPLETPPEGYADKLVMIGGWSMHHPVIEDLMAEWGVENPWHDLVNREDIYLIDHEIGRSLAFLRRWYYPEAEAELIEPLSTQTGLMIYRVTG